METDRGRRPENRDADRERLAKLLAQAKSLEAEKGFLGAIHEVLESLRSKPKEWDLWYNRLHHAWSTEKKAAAGMRQSDPTLAQGRETKTRRTEEDRLKDKKFQAMVKDAERLEQAQRSNPGYEPGTASDDGLEE